MVKAIMTITEAQTMTLQDWNVESVRLHPFNAAEDILTQLRKNIKHLPQVPLQMVSFSPSIQMECLNRCWLLLTIWNTLAKAICRRTKEH